MPTINRGGLHNYPLQKEDINKPKPKPNQDCVLPAPAPVVTTVKLSTKRLTSSRRTKMK